MKRKCLFKPVPFAKLLQKLSDRTLKTFSKYPNSYKEKLKSLDSKL